MIRPAEKLAGVFEREPRLHRRPPRVVAVPTVRDQPVDQVRRLSAGPVDQSRNLRPVPVIEAGTDDCVHASSLIGDQ